MGKQSSNKLKKVSIYLILISLSVVFLYPFLWMLAASFRSLEEIATSGINVIVRNFDLKNYKSALESFPFATYFKNSVIVSIFSIIATVFSSSLVGYAFARFKVKGVNFLFLLVLSTMLLPGEVQLIPRFLMFKNLGMLDTLYPLFITKFFGNSFYIFLFRQFYTKLPTSLEDAAKLDGCGYFKTWFKIFVPLSKPIMGSVAILEFMGSWNSFSDALIYINSDKWKTLPLGLAGFSGTYSTNTNLLMAASILVILPCIIVFFFAQKTFIQGISFSSGKD